MVAAIVVESTTVELQPIWVATDDELNELSKPNESNELIATIRVLKSVVELTKQISYIA